MRKFIAVFMSLLIAAIVFAPKGTASNPGKLDKVNYNTVQDMKGWACVYGYGGWNGGTTEAMRNDWAIYAADALGGEGGTHYATVNEDNTKTTLVKKSDNVADSSIVGECKYDPENIKFQDVNGSNFAGFKAYNVKQLAYAHGINLGQVSGIDCSAGIKSVNAWSVQVDDDAIAYGSKADALKDVETTGGTLTECHMDR